MEPVISSPGNAYILEVGPLENDPAYYFLADKYLLDEEFGVHYAPLVTLPKIIGSTYPRYLYRYAPNETLDISH